MSKGIVKALSYIKDMIEEILPKTDNHNGFICIDDGMGLVTPLADRFEGQRQFSLQVTSLAMDDGSTGLSARKRVTIELNIRYAIPAELGFRIRMMTEDSSKLIDKLKGPQYNFNTTGIVSLIPAQARAEEITDINGVGLGHLLIIPFDLLYLEE